MTYYAAGTEVPVQIFVIHVKSLIFSFYRHGSNLYRYFCYTLYIRDAPIVLVAIGNIMAYYSPHVGLCIVSSH